MRNLTSFLRLMLAAVAALLLTGTLLAASSGSASARPTPAPPSTGGDIAAADNATNARLGGCAWRKGQCFGAIAVNLGSITAYIANDKKSKVGAKRVALRKCRNAGVNAGIQARCRISAWVRNGCAATAVKVANGQVTGIASAIRYNKRPAVRAAKRKLKGVPGTVGVAYVCTTRRR